MKSPGWMIFCLLLVILLMAIPTILVVRSRVLDSAELALDAALVGGIIQQDTARGRISLDERAGYDLARSYFKKNMSLNESLESNLLKKTKIQITFSQNEKRPQAQAQISTVVTALSTKVLGLEGVPITVRGTRYYVSKYK